MAKRKIIDWEGIESEYRAGQLSIRSIASKFTVSDGSIRKRAKRDLWIRDLSDEVRKAVRNKLVRSEVRTSNADPEEIVNAAADRGVTVIECQRSDIKNLRDEESKLLAELGDSPQKLWVGQYQGVVITNEFAIPVTERAAALNALANVQHKRIQLERQAFNLDEVDRNSDKMMIEID